VSRPSTLLRTALLWSGALLCVAGFVATRMWQHWAPGRFAELLILALASLVLAWPLRRWARWSWATSIALPWLLALPLFAGVLPVLATALFALAAIALGGLVAGPAPLALRCAVGLTLAAGVLGWLLPLPVHQRWSYALACLLLVGWRRRETATALRAAGAAWSQAVAAAPRTAAAATLALGLASTACWLPTLQFDDLAYHLSLPWQLMDMGRYALDPSRQVWALAPWAGDVQQGVVQVLAGAEARGPLNALWLLVTAAGLWRLVRALGGDGRAAWLVIALYASLPQTAGLAAGMQTETPTTALLVWLAWLVADAGTRNEAGSADGQPRRRLATAAVLVGGLVGLKLMAAACAAVVVAWASLARRPWPGPKALAGAALLALVVGLSSYTYAVGVAGNPFLPLFNAWFESPYFGIRNFDDPRWHAGFAPLLPWRLTFHTREYSENFAGAAGFTLVALAGAWLLALARRETRTITLVATALFALPLLPLQYLRYAFPGLVLLLVPMALAALHADPRRGAWLLAAMCLLNFAFQANGNWMQRTGALKQAILVAGKDDLLFEHYAPERTLIARARKSTIAGNVLLMSDVEPRYAELGVHGLTVSRYAPRMLSAASRAEHDPSGAAWVALWRAEDVSDVILGISSITPARAAALRGAGAELKQQTGEVQWWRLPPEGTP
jgi:hypothetical protein